MTVEQLYVASNSLIEHFDFAVAIDAGRYFVTVRQSRGRRAWSICTIEGTHVRTSAVRKRIIDEVAPFLPRLGPRAPAIPREKGLI